MRSILYALTVLAAAGASAQSGYFQGVTARPPDVFSLPARLTVTRTAPPGGAPEVVPAMYTHVSTHQDARTFEWANLAVLFNNSDHGANVASYAQARKFGKGVTWGGVMEIQDVNGYGGFHGLQIDAFTTGPSPVPGSTGGDRIGLDIVIGRAFNQGPKATVDYGMLIAPNGHNDDEADINFGVHVMTQCRFACYAMRGGNKFAYEESGTIASKFDPVTGRWGLFHGDKPIFEVDMASGELRVNGRPVVVSYKD
jgi:hypothetical protein